MMLHPSYTDLINVANEGNSEEDSPVVQSRYSIVMAAAKRARQIQKESGKNDTVVKKPLSVAIDELYEGKVKIIKNR